MRTWARSTLLGASFVALGVSAIPGNAVADITSGNSSVLGGNQVNAPVNAPIDACGNAAGVAGQAGAACHGRPAAPAGGGGGRKEQKTSGDTGVASGNQVNAPVNAPVHACGNSVGALGQAAAGCDGGGKAPNNGVKPKPKHKAKKHKHHKGAPAKPRPRPRPGATQPKAPQGGRGPAQNTSGTSSVGGGNQVNTPISLPLDACGNGVGILGIGGAGCENGAKPPQQGTKPSQGGGRGLTQNTSGTSSVGGGNQVNAPISIPVDACGNGAGVLGQGAAGCAGGAKAGQGGGQGGGRGVTQITSGESSVLGGNQVNAPVNAPTNLCGNAIGNAVAECGGGASSGGGGGARGSGGQTTSGNSSVLGGNQVNAPVNAPVNAYGNAVGALGVGAAVADRGAQTRRTSGASSNERRTGDATPAPGMDARPPVNADLPVVPRLSGNTGARRAGTGALRVVKGAPAAAHLGESTFTSEGGPALGGPFGGGLPLVGGLVQGAGLPRTPASGAASRAGGGDGSPVGQVASHVSGLSKVVGGKGLPRVKGVPVAGHAVSGRSMGGEPTGPGLSVVNGLPKPKGLPAVQGVPAMNRRSGAAGGQGASLPGGLGHGLALVQGAGKALPGGTGALDGGVRLVRGLRLVQATGPVTKGRTPTGKAAKGKAPKGKRLAVVGESVRPEARSHHGDGARPVAAVGEIAGGAAGHAGAVGGTAKAGKSGVHAVLAGARALTSRVHLPRR